MDIRRLTSTGAPGAAQANSTTAKRVGAVQSRATGQVELPRLSVYRYAAQSFTTATWTGVSFDFDEYDTASLHSTATASEFYFDAEAAGVWAFSMATHWANNTTGLREIRVLLNPADAATTISQSSSRLLASSNSSSGQGLVQSQFQLAISEGDTIRAQAIQYSGGNLNLTFASFQGFRLGS